MKQMDPRIFWSVFLAVILTVGLLVITMIGVIMAVVFWTCIIIGVVILWPFLPHMPVVINFFLREYELKCHILRVLDVARFDAARTEGWMTALEIMYGVEEISERNLHVSTIYITLATLVRRGAVICEHVPIGYVKDPPKRSLASGVCLAYKVNKNSTYRPRRPKWLPEEQVKEFKGVVGGVAAH